MQTRIGKWGGSCAIRLPKMAVETLNLREGSKVDLIIENGAVVLTPVDDVPSLEELVEQMKGQEQPESFDDGPKGRELI
ncbi:MAG: AbrB/MazE/SpoVT family DNA-binding domain-containing protein [Ahrensia sp.]|nr:AbrB/MazE/SpoVT family DNA-binding domain-containing protein [Ahrensia sp.]